MLESLLGILNMAAPETQKNPSAAQISIWELLQVRLSIIPHFHTICGGIHVL